MRHASPEGIMDEIETGAIRVRAAVLAGQMTDHLAAEGLDEWLWFTLPGGGPNDWAHVPAELVEWCRSARDILEQVARG
jgi:hypothetical protein